MRRTRAIRTLSVVICALIAVGSAQIVVEHTRASGAPRGAERPRGGPAAADLLARLPVRFEANRGQTDPEVAFLARGSGYSLFLTPDEAVLALSARDAAGPVSNRQAVLRMRLVGASRSPAVTGVERLPGVANHFVGADPSAWVTAVPTYAKVRSAGVYPGVDLEYHGFGGELEFDFVVQPGADPDVISMSFEGADRVRLVEGDLVLSTSAGAVRQRRPVIYQEMEGRRRTVPGRYALDAEGRVGVAVGDYDRSRPLVIDPVLTYSTHLGGFGTDRASGVAVDGAGHAYVTGATESGDFPTRNALQPRTAGGLAEVFIAKLDPAAAGDRSLLWSTYLGGKGEDVPSALAVTPGGDVYIAGKTSTPSNDPGVEDFPTSENALRRGTTRPNATQGATDGFVTKLVAGQEGVSLAYSTYLGGTTGTGTAADEATDIAVADGQVYVSGWTLATDFPTTPGAIEPTASGGFDAYLARLDPNASGPASLVYSTYLGGAGLDRGTAVAVDGSHPGHAYLTGRADSSACPAAGDGSPACRPEDFPTTFVAPLRRVFVARVDTDAAGTSGLVYANRFGSSNAVDQPNGIVARDGRAFVGGQTFGLDFPTTTGAVQRSRLSDEDGFVAVVDTSRQDAGSLVYSTYLGGFGASGNSSIGQGDAVNGIALANDGTVVVAGQTVADDFPTTTGAFQSTRRSSPLSDPHDGFVVRLDASKSGRAGLAFATYVGGRDRDRATAVALDANDNAYLAGETASSDFPLLDAPFQGDTGGTLDAFLARITPSSTVTPVVRSVTPGSGSPGGATQVVIEGTGFTGATRVAFGAVATPPCSAGDTGACFTAESDTRISGRTPAHAAGRVDVTVTKLDATSFRSRAAVFVFGPEGAWQATAPTTSSRYGHTATLLANGEVLVVGGIDLNGNVLRSTELFDPTAADLETAWRSGAALAAGRHLHTATLLPSGQVLVAGGVDASGTVLQSAEVYDPASRTWTSWGSLGTNRFGHSATLLPTTAKVLVAGGSNTVTGLGALSSAELLDIATGSSVPTTDMAVQRRFHTATLLPGDRVLVQGAGTPPGASPEIYEPAQGEWRPAAVGSTAVGSTIPRFHTATSLASGDVVTVAGQRIEGGLSNVADRYEATTGMRSEAGRLGAARYGHGASVLPAGAVLAAGGMLSTSRAAEPTRSSEVVHPGTQTTADAGDMVIARGPRLDDAAISVEPGPTATLLSGDPSSFVVDPARCGSHCGKVLVVGGSDDSRAELYTPAPTVTGLSPSSVRYGESTWVEVSGTGFTFGPPDVTFGGIPAQEVRVASFTTLFARTPAPGEASAVRVDVTTGSGLASAAELFRYTGAPGAVTDLAASAVASSEVRLTFSATGSVARLEPVAEAYLIKQSRTPITDEASFEAARSLCGGPCTFAPGRVGAQLTQGVTGLSPGTTYHYALRALDAAGQPGSMSNVASVTTASAGEVSSAAVPLGGDGPLEPLSPCPPLGVAGRGEVTVRGGYSLLGLPEGTRAPGAGRLFGWLDQGAGGAYSRLDAGQAMTGGRGYWSWSPCPRRIDVPSPTEHLVRLHLGAYRASMVGNPSADGPALVSGYDYAARWDPALNRGQGGYHLSKFRESQLLAVGEGMWVFSYTDTTVIIDGRH